MVNSKSLKGGEFMFYDELIAGMAAGGLSAAYVEQSLIMSWSGIALFVGVFAYCVPSLLIIRFRKAKNLKVWFLSFGGTAIATSLLAILIIYLRGF
jgi:hypothetical protein